MPRKASFRKSIDKLKTLAPPGAPQAQLDAITELGAVLEQIEQVLAGELRIVAAGAVASMKSTMLELLLGRPGQLLVGSGAVTAAPTYLRLVQGDGQVAARSQVRMLTEAGARRRAMALLGITDDDNRSLPELARMEHANQGLVAQMAADERVVRLGHSYDLEEYLQKPRGLRIGSVGASLVDRVRVDVVVPAEVWNLSWARGRTVVLIDLPGTGEGRALENLISEQQRAAAHLALNVVGVGAGSGFTPPRVHADSDCVLVATKLDHVENPASGELRTLEDAVHSVLRNWRQSGRNARVAAISGAWSCLSREAWDAFDPGNHAIWDSAEQARQRWATAAWDSNGPTGGELRTAVEAALRDGGAERLRQLIAELAVANQARVDEVELHRLVATALALVEEADGTGGQPQARIDRVCDQVDADPRPMDELRRIARELSAAAVYGLSVWDEVCIRSFRPSGEWRGSMPDVHAAFAEIDVEAVAATAIEEAGEQLRADLGDWVEGYAPAVRLAYDFPDASTGPAAGFGKLGDRLFRAMLTGRPSNGQGREQISVRQLARTRLELAVLLERRLVDLFNPVVDQARQAVADSLIERQLSERASLDTGTQLQSLRRELRKLVPARLEP